MRLEVKVIRKLIMVSELMLAIFITVPSVSGGLLG